MVTNQLKLLSSPWSLVIHKPDLVPELNCSSGMASCISLFPGLFPSSAQEGDALVLAPEAELYSTRLYLKNSKKFLIADRCSKIYDR